MKKMLVTMMFAVVPLWAAAHPLHVEDAWIRATVLGQQGTGGFMTLKSKDGVTLTGVSVDAAVGIAELHEMALDGDVMRMHAVEQLAVPAGKPVVLKSGGHHLMLVGLKTPLVKGSKVNVTFSYRDAKGVAGKQSVAITVDTVAPGQTMPAHVHGAGHDHPR